VTENSRAFVATAVGAVVGGVAGYMLFTERGRTLRRQLEPAVEDLVRELSQFRGTVQRMSGMASEGWRLLNEAIGDGGESAARSIRYSNPHQSSPF
jgi:hypothetical protein